MEICCWLFPLSSTWVDNPFVEQLLCFIKSTTDPPNTDSLNHQPITSYLPNFGLLIHQPMLVGSTFWIQKKFWAMSSLLIKFSVTNCSNICNILNVFEFLIWFWKFLYVLDVNKNYFYCNIWSYLIVKRF